MLDSKGTGPTETEPQPPDLSLDTPPAFDPVAGGPVSLGLETDADLVELVVVDASGAVVLEAQGPTSWDGKIDGAWATPGLYRVEVTATDSESGLSSEASADLGLVRVGVISAWADDEARVPLYWMQAKSLQDTSLAFSEVAGLEDEGGVATTLPAVGEDLTAPSGAEPLAWAWDARPTLTLIPGEETVLGSTGLDAVEVGLSVEGWTVLSGLPVSPGTPIVLQKDEGLASGPQVVEGELALQWTVEGETFSTQALPWRAYALLGPATFDETGVLYNPWVAAVDPALRGIAGVAADRDAVLDALVEWIFRDAGLSYDTVSGASAYVSWSGGWEDEEFNFTAFLRRAFGDVVNCTDCAHILLTYANMLGAELNYTIILQDFQLNYILAIGGEEFTHCPFGSWGCGFSYHAVTTTDSGVTIWDATLALDGDDDPSNEPCTELLVQSVDGEEYLDRLVMSGRARYEYEAKGTLR